ncbi:SPE_1075/MLC_0560 family membrane protein [Spiroplasma diminutum]|uniref:Transmembrane protein n=1 Tax=Spiroplasma diminutum CUAS-1 TaxID=1276221 RepID=S5M0Y8_9MOLU|nr:hypothetical protein [Spiroplasma diminutum]AGR42521.1 transmembrane protein [Spiroplasma diminutum CUAS-1]
MKYWLKNQKKLIKNNWKGILIKVILLILGVIVSSFGLALYQQPAVGGSQIDWFIYNALSLVEPFSKDGSVRGEVLNKFYPTSLTLVYIILIIFAIGFSIKPTMEEYKKLKSKIIWFSFLFVVIADIAITFIVPQIVGLFLRSLSELNIKNTDPNNLAIRNLALIGGFLAFVIGIALWVKSGLLLGPFNNICTQFIRLTKMNYAMGRLLIDISILILGFILFPFIIGEEGSNKTNFLLTNFGLGTICFTFLVGPIVNTQLNILNKFIDYEKLSNKK